MSRYNLWKHDQVKAAKQVSANKWFLPLVWATDICARALAEGHIRPQVMMLMIMIMRMINIYTITGKLYIFKAFSEKM